MLGLISIYIWIAIVVFRFEKSKIWGPYFELKIVMLLITKILAETRQQGRAELACIISEATKKTVQVLLNSTQEEIVIAKGMATRNDAFSG